MYNFYNQVYFRSFKLGALYEIATVPGKIVKFIKVTRKGYNLLDISTNKCILYRHLYSRKFSHKEIPEELSIVTDVAVQKWLILEEVKEKQ